MLKWILKSIVGSKNQREIKKTLPIVEEINRLEEDLQKQDESILKEKTIAWQAHLHRYEERIEFFNRRRLEDLEADEVRPKLKEWSERFEKLAEEFGSLADFPTPMQADSFDKERSIAEILRAQELFNDIRDQFPASRKQFLDEILPEAFAVVKNAGRRLCGTSWNVCDHPIAWEMVHFDVQLVGGIGLHRGMIAEMATGEGKTLVATLPVYLNALTGLGVHLVTVNDYLARRDSEWMGHLYEYLGLTVGCIQNDQRGDSRREQYEKDITFGTASEFGFDYLRDNGMSQRKEEQVQHGHYFALIDEVDSILIDEARTPLIISGPVVARNDQQYDRYKGLIQQLYRKQTALCNQLATDAKTAWEKEDAETTGLNLFKVRLGQPRNRGLMRAMEDPELRRLIEKTELEFYKDPQKKALFELKEELFFTLDEKQHEAELTEQGRNFLDPDDPDAFVLPDLAEEFSQIDGDTSVSDEKKAEIKQGLQDKMNSQAERMHTITQLLRAFCLYEKDIQYMVSENRVIILDENTGRAMPGRRWSDGLHQAVEAKEGVKIEGETQTYATITIQNYFRLYEKLGGMTGTAETEAAEFHDIYKLEVMIIPTNKPIARVDLNDKIYKTRREKFKAVIDLVAQHHAMGQPILLGTASVESSETLSRMLKREKIPHNVLNAKYHLKEAEIVTRAGLKGAVTVATNMAGRGTDIKLGEGVADNGGLFVIGTERHQSRRIDRQLRGRCSRQGDPGRSVFYVSFEDDLMINFGAAERMTRMMERFGLEEGQELEHKWLNRSVESAQKKVEQRNYVSRKHILEYDDVMNNQRAVVYGYRNEVLSTEDPHSLIHEVIEDAIPARVEEFLDPESGEPDYGAVLHWVNTTFLFGLSEKEADFGSRSTDDNIEFLIERVKQAYEKKSAYEPPEILENLERYIILNSIDNLWQEHLYEMDGLRESIGNYRYAQKDPLVEYKHKAYEMFLGLMDRIKSEVLGALFRTTARQPDQLHSFLQGLPQKLTRADPLADLAGGPMPGTGGGGGGGVPVGATAGGGPRITLPVKREEPKVGRNAPCPCGSGKKFKQCCGRSA